MCVELGKEVVEDSADGLELPGIRLFRSLFGVFPFSVSKVGDRNILPKFRSRDGVVAGVEDAESGTWGFSGISNLLSDDRGVALWACPDTIDLVETFLVGVPGAVGDAGDTFSIMWPDAGGGALVPVDDPNAGLDSCGLSAGFRMVGLGACDLRDGSVLLRATPILGLPGTDFLDDTETFRLIPP